MVKRIVRAIAVSRTMTVVLLILTSAVIAGITLSLSGKAYSKVDAVPFRDLRVLVEKLSQGPIRFEIVVALMMPMLMNLLLFLPWGFLMFLSVERPERSIGQAYLVTFLTALAFSGAIEAAQYFLPTRVTDVNDVLWNGVGALVGAVLGHLHRRVRVSFE